LEQCTSAIDIEPASLVLGVSLKSLIPNTKVKSKKVKCEGT
jgi:hypothetical protein